MIIAVIRCENKVCRIYRQKADSIKHKRKSVVSGNIVTTTAEVAK